MSDKCYYCKYIRYVQMNCPRELFPNIAACIKTDTLIHYNDNICKSFKMKKETESFLDFCATIKYGFAVGDIKTDKKFSELDLAIDYALGKEFEKGKHSSSKPLEFTIEQLASFIEKHTGIDIEFFDNEKFLGGNLNEHKEESTHA